MKKGESQTPPRAPHHRAEHVFQLIERLKLSWLLAHLPPTAVWASYVFVNSFATIGLLALLAFLTHNPFVFPSLGPTAYLFFFTPLAETASPRNAVLGHAIALCCGFTAFSITGMSHLPPGLPVEIYWPRVLSAAISLSLTGAIMVLLRVSHPPAGATTMIVSLGIISKPGYLVTIEAAVILLTAQAFVINRVAGLSYPIWRHRESPSQK
ncbi:MAG: HPP family protein [Acidobacteriota bacterium]|nr:HPP family protein [Acidobacteriota bacterium]MDQ2843767.1 HPP family protein [Acidobacteriota bacterium]